MAGFYRDVNSLFALRTIRTEKNEKRKIKKNEKRDFVMLFPFITQFLSRNFLHNLSLNIKKYNIQYHQFLFKKFFHFKVVSIIIK